MSVIYFVSYICHGMFWAICPSSGNITYKVRLYLMLFNGGQIA